MDHLDQATKILSFMALVVGLTSGGAALWFRDRIGQFFHRRRTPGSTFLDQYNHKHDFNARPYLGFLAGAIPERSTPFDSHDIDVIRSWITAVRPDATPHSSSGAAITFVVHTPDNSAPAWIAQIRAGPVLAVHAEVGLRRYGREDGLGDYGVSVLDAVEWWESMIEALPRLLNGLRASKVALGFTVQTIPSELPFVTYLAFDVANQGLRLGHATSVTPWSALIERVGRAQLSPTLVHTLVPDLARHFGVWHVDDCLKFLEESFRRRHSPGAVIYVRDPARGLLPWRRMSRIYLGPLPGGAQYQVLDETTFQRWTADVYVPGGTGDWRVSGWVLWINGEQQAGPDSQALAFPSQDDALSFLMTYTQHQFK